eukprot:1162136-Pelagomonas_calceolata.AAC.4
MHCALQHGLHRQWPACKRLAKERRLQRDAQALVSGRTAACQWQNPYVGFQQGASNEVLVRIHKLETVAGDRRP